MSAPLVKYPFAPVRTTATTDSLFAALSKSSATRENTALLNAFFDYSIAQLQGQLDFRGGRGAELHAGVRRRGLRRRSTTLTAGGIVASWPILVGHSARRWYKKRKIISTERAGAYPVTSKPLASPESINQANATEGFGPHGLESDSVVRRAQSECKGSATTSQCSTILELRTSAVLLEEVLRSSF